MADVTTLDPHRRTIEQLLLEFAERVEEFDGIILLGLNKDKSPLLRMITTTKELSEAIAFLQYQMMDVIYDHVGTEE